jgi:methionine sulfoxide reductase heme-binding subunit
VKTAEKIIGHKAFALAVIVGVGVWFLVIPAFTGGLGADPLDRLLHTTGEIAIWALGTVLSLTPLRVLFPKSRIVNALNRHRRYIGVSSCIYGLLHFTCHILYQGSLDALLASFSKAFIWFGFTGLTMLVILALTSNNWMVRKLGAKNWKRLHRLAYLAAVILIYHQSIAGKGHWYISRWLLFPLLGLQIARLAKTYLFKSPVRAAATRRAGIRSS